MKNKLITDFVDNNLFELPLIYSLLHSSLKKGNVGAFVESEFHQTIAYKADRFYKPVSKIVSPKISHG